MKHILTSLSLLFTVVSFASGNNASLVAKQNTTANTAEVNAAATINKLQLENKMLLAKIDLLQEAQEESASQVSYQQNMYKVITNATQLKQQQMFEELDAKLSYQRTMTLVLNNLRHSGN